MVEPTLIEQKTDLIRARSVEIGATLGGLVIASITDLETVSLRLARGMVAVPLHCRDQPGVCFALAMQALEWGMPIMSVINKSYVPRNGDRIGYESQLLHAVIEKNAPLKNRLRYEIIGEGNERRCKVWGTFEGEDKPHAYTSETLAKLHPGHVTKDGREYVRGSQLWDDNPEVQMFYSASRQWSRLFCPDVLLGAYTPEEMESSPPIDVTPKLEQLAQRLKDAKAQHATTFDADEIGRAANSIIEGDVVAETEKQDAGAQGSDSQPVDQERRDDDAGGVSGDQDKARRDAAGAGDQVDGKKSAGSRQGQPDQSEIFPPDRKASKPQPPKGKRR